MLKLCTYKHCTAYLGPWTDGEACKHLSYYSFLQLTWLFCHGVRTVVWGRTILGETNSYLESLVHGDGGRRPSK